MGRTRPLLQQIIMGVKINLAKWSDALLETSNCFSLILLPPPRSLRAANDAVVGADVSRGGGGELGGCSQGAAAHLVPHSPLRAGLSHGSHISSRAPHPHQDPHPTTRHPPPCPLQHQAQACSSTTLHQARPVGNSWEGKGDLFAFHPAPCPFLLSTRGTLCPKPTGAPETHRSCQRGRHRIHTDQHIQVDDHK